MNVFSIIFPVIFVTVIGFVLANKQFLNRVHIEGLSKLTFTIIVPPFLFVTMATSNLGEIFSAKVIGAYYLPVFSFYGLAMLYHYIAAKDKPRDIPASAVFAMANTYSNIVLLGLPITLAALGEEIAAHVFVVLSFHGMMMIGFTNFCGTFGEHSSDSKKQSFWRKLAKLASNPILASIFTGMLYNLSGLTLGPDLAAALKLLGKPAITCALIILGTSLHYYSVKGRIAQIAAITAIKLIIMPFFVWLSAVYIFDLSKELTALVVLLASSPTGVNAYLVASGLHKHEALVASTVVVTTVLCMFSMTGWLIFLL
jgi:predicted permease